MSSSQNPPTDTNDGDDMIDITSMFRRREPHEPVPSWALPWDDEEKLAEALNNNPFFMTKDPTPEQVAANPMLSALQSLMFDGTPDEVAERFLKLAQEQLEKGQPSYPDAARYCLQARDLNPSNPQVRAGIALGLATVHFQKRNYGKAIQEAQDCIALEKDTIKAHTILMLAYFELGKLEEAVKACETAMALDKMDPILIEYHRKIQDRRKQEEQKQALLQMEHQTRMDQSKKLLRALQHRRVQMKDSQESIFTGLLNIISLPVPTSELPTVQYDAGADELFWPVFFLYPKAKESDFLASVSEDACLLDLLSVVFETLPAWDTQKEYQVPPGQFHVFWPHLEGSHLGGSHLGGPSSTIPCTKVPLDIPLRKLISSPTFTVLDGRLLFLIAPSPGHLLQNGFTISSRHTQ